MKMPNFFFEKEAWDKNIDYVIGVDEVGRGSFAGPVTVGAVIFKKNVLFKDSILSRVNDSKLLNPRMRLVLSKKIKKEALLYSVSNIKVSIINRVGIGKATQMAMRKAVMSIMYNVFSIKYKDKKMHDTNYTIPSAKFFVLVDGFHIKYLKGIGLKNQKGIIKGDRKSVSIAAASIIAKVHRDNLMRKISKKYPAYGFSQNKGYGTKFHQEAIQTYGLSEIHRTSFNLSKFL